MTESLDEIGAFKTSTLRNVAGPPFMHDGSLATLRDVVEHYNNGGVTRKDASTMNSGGASATFNLYNNSMRTVAFDPQAGHPKDQTYQDEDKRIAPQVHY